MDPEFLGDLLQGLAALRQPLDRLGLVLGREPAPLPLLHRSFPVLVDPTLRGCPPSRGRLRRPSVSEPAALPALPGAGPAAIRGGYLISLVWNSGRPSWAAFLLPEEEAIGPALEP